MHELSANFIVLSFSFIFILSLYLALYGVHGREVECLPRNHKVPSSIPWSMCQMKFSSAKTFGASTQCSSQEAEFREISGSCKNLFLNHCKINKFKLN